MSDEPEEELDAPDVFEEPELLELLELFDEFEVLELSDLLLPVLSLSDFVLSLLC